MPLPDNRIRYPAPRIDFASDVGVTGQTHDDYPAANQQARYDWMRITLIGLLSLQSSHDSPTQYREGTPWFDLNDATLKIRRNGAWVNFADAIKLADTANPSQPLTLLQWFNNINSNVESLQNELFFQGSIVSSGVTLIPIPTSLLPNIISTSRPFLYVNGALVNPATVSLEPGANPTAVSVPSGLLQPGDEFVVIIKSIPNSRFIVSPVTV